MEKPPEPQIVATFAAIDKAKADLNARFPDDYAQLHPIVPFVVELVPEHTRVCIALKGALASKVPAHWRHDTASTLLTSQEHERLVLMARIVESRLEDAGVTPSIEFESQARIDEVGSFHYFR